jgi:hypothetical protein
MGDHSASFGPRVAEEPFYTSSPWEPELPPVERLKDVDVTDPDLITKSDPHAPWKLLCEEAPVIWHEKGGAGTDNKGFWAVAGYEGFNQVLKDTENFRRSLTGGPGRSVDKSPWARTFRGITLGVIGFGAIGCGLVAAPTALADDPPNLGEDTDYVLHEILQTGSAKGDGAR